MGIKILTYSALFFFVMMIFLMVKEPYTLKSSDISGQNVPDIELFNAKNYQIKETGVESIVTSSRVARFKEFDQLFFVNVKHKNNQGLIDTIISDEAVLQNGVITFLQNSHYSRNDGVSLDGEEIRYEIEKKILSSQKPFIFTQQQSRTAGLSFVYQMKEGTIAANNIYSVIQAGKKR
ncbi:MAG: LPS export ABC transporter periplasmic protein LptC [Sulfurospirillaceae bacterium]|nr:LPS export ABC transporter periplasmic protein LptC [Sulfurospirillaceae bacterium]MDD2826615.1 LPS export ABC transporter periplasmic protein LptC [Sulfurospirillaceae bacterium]